jgi:hypothetical protein
MQCCKKLRIIEQNKHTKFKMMKTTFPKPKFILFSSRFLANTISAHLQKAFSKPTSYFAKELIFLTLYN